MSVVLKLWYSWYLKSPFEVRYMTVEFRQRIKPIEIYQNPIIVAYNLQMQCHDKMGF